MSWSINPGVHMKSFYNQNINKKRGGPDAASAIAWLKFKNVGLMQLKAMVDKDGDFNKKNEEEEEGAPDFTLLLKDEVLVKIFEKLWQDPYPCSLVCRRWLRLQGSLWQKIKVHDWGFLEQGRMTARFPNLTEVDLTRACIPSPQNVCVMLTHGSLTISLDSQSFDRFVHDERKLAPGAYDRGLRALAEGCPGLQKLALVDLGKGEIEDSNTEPRDLDSGLALIAQHCVMLQELEIYQCSDECIGAISAFRNLQILRLVSSADGFHRSVVSDIGLTILARGCTRLVKLELSGCQGSYDGIAAIGRCCLMLEELTLCNHDLDEGWIAGLSFCSNLKTLKLQSCKRIDSNPGPIEHLGRCPALEKLQLQRCNLRDKQGTAALMLVCGYVRELEIQDCWGLEDEVFSFTVNCRRIKYLSLEGCSLLTTGGLEAVVLAWKDLQWLRVVSCNNIRDSEITPTLASLFSILKELKWRPDTKSVLSATLSGTGMGQKGGRFFKRV